MRDEPFSRPALPKLTRRMSALGWGATFLWLLAFGIIYLFPTSKVAALLPMSAHQVIHQLQLWRIFTWVFVESPSSFTGIVSLWLSVWLFGSALESEIRWRTIVHLLVVGWLGATLAALGLGLFPAFQTDPIQGGSLIASVLVVGWGFALSHTHVQLFSPRPIRAPHFAVAMLTITCLLALSWGNTASAATLGSVFAAALWMFIKTRNSRRSIVREVMKPLRSGKEHLRLIRGSGGTDKDDKLRWN